MATSASATAPGFVAASVIGLTIGYLLGRRRSSSASGSSESPPCSPHLSPRSSQLLTQFGRRLTEEQLLRESAASQQTSLGIDSKSRRASEEEDGSDLEDSDLGRVYGLGGYSQSSRVLLCMVGLPARGKSYITKMLSRYLLWSGFPVKDFNAGNVRRSEGLASATADFFKGSDEATQRREAIADVCMSDAIGWLRAQKSVCVAIFDATNTTRKRRLRIIERCKQSNGITPVFVESICDDVEILERNYALKLGNADYKDMDRAEARADFIERVKAYEKRYETITDDEADGTISYVKLFNVGQKVVARHCSGYLTSQLGFFLSNVHLSPRCIWLSRHAESEDQLQGVLGSHRRELTKNGRMYCKNLANYLQKCAREMEEAGEADASDILVLMGTVPVHYSTLQTMAKGSRSCLAELEDPTPGGHVYVRDFQAMSSSLLNELDGGVCNGLSYDVIKRDYPDLWAERERDKLHFRYPNGESYTDVIARLRPIIIELERQRRSILVISHLAVQRCLYAYFAGCPMEELPYLSMEMHSVVELRPGAFECGVKHVELAPTSHAPAASLSEKGP